MKRDVELLDCTIRDGNYAVDFKFTTHDTRVLTGELARLGFRWVEVGHGVGLGGSEAGKGQMVDTDIAFIRAAREVAGNAKVGVFFIPGIGRMEHLRAARDAGLDFVRIGQNATQLAETFPFVAEARRLGLLPCVNMMKSYGVTPDQFGELARQAGDAGAEVVYCVDSAGSMFPEDVRRYFEAARARTDCRLGFHGHNNLMLVISNCIEAQRCGVEFLDVTLAGLGRSAGNAPSEILVAVCRKLGIETGLDLFEVMDAVDTYLWPLVSRIRPHDMLGVAGGFSQFHSSFLPKVAEAARKHRAELRRLVVKVALHDPVDLDLRYLEQAARELAGTARVEASNALVTFQSERFAPGRIATSQRSVDDLVLSLTAATAKNVGAWAALHLVPSPEPDEDLLNADFVLSDAQWALGRVMYGSFRQLEDVVRRAWPRVGLFVVSVGGGWASGAAARCREWVDPDRVIPIRDEDLRALHLRETMDDVLTLHPGRDVLVYGTNPEIERALLGHACDRPLYWFGVAEAPAQVPGPKVHIGSWSELASLNLRFGVVIVAETPDEDDLRHLVQVSEQGGLVLLLAAARPEAWSEAGLRVVLHKADAAYAGILQRYLARASARGLILPRPGAET